MARGYWRPRKTECGFCGARDKELKRFGRSDLFMCGGCAQRNGYKWEIGKAGEADSGSTRMAREGDGTDEIYFHWDGCEGQEEQNANN